MVAAAPPLIEDLTPAQRLVIVKSYIGLQVGLQELADAYAVRLRTLLSHDELSHAADRGWLYRPQAPTPVIDDSYSVVILAAPFDRPDTLGRFFDHRTDFHVDRIPMPLLMFNHGLGPADEPGSGGPDITGRITRRWSDTRGIWYSAKLSRTHPLAQLCWDAAKRGTCRASTASITNLQRTEVDGFTSHWVAIEISLFPVESRAARQPAHGWSVCIPANVKLPPMVGDVPAAFGWAVERKIDTDPQLQHLRAQLAQFVVPKEPS